MRLRLHSWWAEAVPQQAIHEFQDCKDGLSVGSWNVLQPKAHDPNSSKLHIYLEYIWIPKPSSSLDHTWTIRWESPLRCGYGNPVPNPIKVQLHNCMQPCLHFQLSKKGNTTRGEGLVHHRVLGGGSRLRHDCQRNHCFFHWFASNSVHCLITKLCQAAFGRILK